ncbi:MAG: right-handed parallel beta-helix repeat-containing protein, partial [Candidatus Omnitrophica bacterium]|nr:right-handed parallel beta-helix repeat-containing protein [Candidatus Omnitrophota bacterium]
MLFLIPGSGRSQAGNFPTPLDFGAVGDGVVDDSAAIQSAIDASGTIYLADRVYRIAVGLDLPEGSNLIGPGTLLADFDTGDSSHLNTAIRLNGDNIRVENLAIEKTFTDGSQGSGISALGIQNLVLESVEISGYSKGAGIQVQGCTRFEVRECRVHDFLLNSTEELTGDDPAGIRILGSTDGIVSENRIDRIEIGPNRRGVSGYPAANLSLQTSSRVAVIGNHLQTSGVGIDLATIENSVVSANVIADQWSEGIRATATKFCAITGNHLTDQFQGIALRGGDIADSTDEGCEPVESLPPIAIQGIVGSVEGGLEDGSSEGDTLAHLADGSFTNRTLILQNGGPNFTFLIDLLDNKTLSDMTIVSESNYRPGGQYLGGTVTLETANDIEGPYTLRSSEAFTCTRPPSDQMITETPSAPATGGEARRIALASPVTARYVRIGSTYCLDNVVLMSEALANHGPVVYRMRPLGPAFAVSSRLPIHMTDGSLVSYFESRITAGTVDLDLGPYPAEIQEIRIVGRTGSLSSLPQSGRFWVSSDDSPENFDTLVRTYNLVQSDGKITITIEPGFNKRYLRLNWEGLQGQSDTRTVIAEIQVDRGEACIPSTISPVSESVGNVINGNTILDSGSPGSFGIAGSDRIMGASATGIDFGANPLYNSVTDNFIADRQMEKTLEVGIQIPQTASGNIETDNLVSLELEQSTTPSPTVTPSPTTTVSTATP